MASNQVESAMADIFLSYRRSDEPGYVGRLADNLMAIFGEDAVFRDIDDEHAGGNWKKSLSRAVSGAQVVLAVIGPRWLELLWSRSSDTEDWTRFELNQARSLDIPVIPVSLAQPAFDHATALGDLDWLKDLHFFELADGQGRWQADINRLAQEIERLTDLKARPHAAEQEGNIFQQSHGAQSPNVNSGGGDVSISFGNEDDNN